MSAARAIIITIRFSTGQQRVESYVNKAAGRNHARATFAYFMQLCLNGEVESVTMQAGEATPEMILIGAAE